MTLVTAAPKCSTLPGKEFCLDGLHNRKAAKQAEVVPAVMAASPVVQAKKASRVKELNQDCRLDSLEQRCRSYRDLVK